MRRGLTLVECLIGMTAGGVILAATCGVLVAAQRAAVALAATLDARHNAEAATGTLQSELRTAARGEVIRLADSAIALRALRAVGFVCAADSGSTRVVLDGASLSSLRAIDPLRDSVRVLAEEDLDKSGDDRWIQAGISSTGGGTCPGGAPGDQLSLSAISAADMGAVRIGAPARVVEVVEYRRYPDGSGLRMFGIRSPSGSGWSASSPIAGPLDASAGFRLVATDALGSLTLDPDSVVLLHAEVRVRSRRALDSSFISIAPVRP